MMDTKEKLVEILDRFVYDDWYGNEDIAEKLISNGVTVQEWISVDDRLPEDSATVLVCHKNGLVTTNAWLGAHWWFKDERNPITHWMPLPQPPKGEKK